LTITFIGHAYASSGSPPTDPTATTMACDTGGTGAGALAIQAGDLLRVCLKWETSNGGGTSVSSVSGAPANAFTMGTVLQNTTNNDMWTQTGWVLAASADPAAVFQATWGTGVNYRRLSVLQFRGNGGVFSLASAGATGQGAAATTLTTANFSAPGTDQVLCMATGLYGSANYTTNTFGGVAGTQPTGSPLDNTLISYLFTGAVSNIAAVCTIDAGQDWNIIADAFRLDAAAIPSVVYSIPNSFFFGANQ
jgi:hypothetical protein